jgi:NADH-quinone oxidoreductase subunit N
MNAIIISAVWGVLMMYAGFFLHSKRSIHLLAITGICLMIGATAYEYLSGIPFVTIDTKGMLQYTGYGLAFLMIMLVSTLVYFILSGNDIHTAGKSASDLYALVFFILTGIAVVAGYRSLLMLFLGIEIVSIPLYVLAGSDKANLKSNEAALKYFLMGSFSTGFTAIQVLFIWMLSGLDLVC